MRHKPRALLFCPVQDWCNACGKVAEPWGPHGYFLDAETKKWKIQFTYQGRQQKFSLKHDNETLALEAWGRVQRVLRDLREGAITLPEGTSIVEFVKSNGTRTEAVPVEKPDKMTVEHLFKIYEEKLTAGSKAANSLYTNMIHGRHIVRVLGENTKLHDLTKPGKLQKYVDKRVAEDMKARTAKKETATLAMVWRWANAKGHLKVPCPDDAFRNLTYPSETELGSFQTWEEIVRQIARGGLSKDEEAALWECLFLDTAQVEEVLDFVQANAKKPWIYPAFLFVAHTGARRSEMIRSEIDDFDFDGGDLTIRERKRVKGKVTTRKVSMSPRLRRDFKKHYFSPRRVATQEVASRFPINLTTAPAQFLEHGRARRPAHRIEEYVQWAAKRTWIAFQKVFGKSKWKVLHGYHVFRHSMCSNLASRGVDQRRIDGMIGHETEAMRRRYRHLFPKDGQDAIRQLFGE